MVQENSGNNTNHSKSQRGLFSQHMSGRASDMTKKFLFATLAIAVLAVLAADGLALTGANQPKANISNNVDSSKSSTPEDSSANPQTQPALTEDQNSNSSSASVSSDGGSVSATV